MDSKITILINDDQVSCETDGLDVFQTLFFLEIAKKIVIDEGFVNNNEDPPE